MAQPLLHRTHLILATLALAACDAPAAWRGFARETGQPASLDTAALRADSVLVGAGDIASCNSDADETTAALLDSIPGTVFTAGDNVYPYGSPANYRDCYAPTWGRHRWRTRPAPGDHEHSSAYYAYFGGAAGPAGRGYYAYEKAGWQIVVLNTNLPLTRGSRQLDWLDRTLREAGALCQVAVLHVPRFSSGAKHGASEEVRAAWDVLFRHGVELVLSGDSHIYERYPPLDPAGRADPRGVRQFIVGTGGRYLHDLTDRSPASEARDASTFGVLKLTLRPAGYAWEFVPAAGGRFRDSGAGRCHVTP